MTEAIKLSPAEEQLVAQLKAQSPEAAERLATGGLPSRRVESYHYTDLKMLLREVPEIAAAANSTSAPALRIPGSYRIVIANGLVEPSGTAPAGVIAGSVKGGVLSKDDDVIVRLNDALVAESLDLKLDLSVDPVIHIDRRMEGEAGHINDAAKIYVGDDASAVIVETVSGSDEAHLGNHATYVALGKNAKLAHIFVDLSGENVRHFANLEYHLAEGAQLRTLTVHQGTRLSRSQIFAHFDGEGAHADFTGLNLVDEGQHCDITLDISHAVPNTTSTETYKTVARGRGRGVFQGKIVVAQDAQKTDAKMMAQGLMLSPEAEIFAKPELEIFADDVVCGHGATCGELDDTHLFYLMSRGIPKAQAKTILVRAFLEELFDFIEDEELHEALSSVADAWLERGEL
jgi:Fe-S cluster assembly protein SufD